MSEPEAADVSLSGETLKATAAKFTMAAAGFAGTIIFAWELGAAGLGAFYVLMSAAHIANRTTGGIADAIQKRASETEFPADEGFGLGILALVAWTGFCTVGVFLVEDWFVSYAGFENAPLAFGVIVFTVGAFIVVQALLSATGQIG